MGTPVSRRFRIVKHWRAHRYPWPLGLSLSLHAAAAAVYFATRTYTPSPPSRLPEIEMLPPAPTAPHEEQAQPSPDATQTKPTPSIAAIPIAQPKRVLRPLTTTADQAEITPSESAQPPSPTLQQANLAIGSTGRTNPDPAAELAATPVTGSAAAQNNTPGIREHSRRAAPPIDYIGLIMTRLERFKRYPPDARVAHQEGTVLLSFELNNTGKVTEWAIARSSGVAPLDREAVDLIQRAQPFPPFPPTYAQNSLRLKVPVEFSLKPNRDSTE